MLVLVLEGTVIVVEVVLGPGTVVAVVLVVDRLPGRVVEVELVLDVVLGIVWVVAVVLVVDDVVVGRVVDVVAVVLVLVVVGIVVDGVGPSTEMVQLFIGISI